MKQRLRRIARGFLTALTLFVLAAWPLCGTASATTVTSLYISSAVDLEAVCTVNVTVELNIDTSTETLSFSMPDGAQNGSVTGYRAKVKNNTLTITRDGGFVGANTFQLSWTVPATVTDNTSDVDLDGIVQSVTVSIPLQGAGLDWPVEKAAFQVSLPKTFESTPEVYSGYYGLLYEDQYTLETGGTVISCEIAQSLLDHEALSIELTLPADYFAEQQAVKNSSIGWAAALVCLLLLAAAELYRRQKLRFRILDIAPRVQPPENVTAGAVPFLLDGSEPDAATLLTQWGCLGYLSIINRGRARTTFYRRMSMGNERKNYENAMFSAMFAGREVCQSSEKSFRRACAALGGSLRKYWRAQVFDPKGGSVRLVRGLAALSAAVTTAAAAYGLLPDGATWTVIAAALGLVGLWLGVQMAAAAASDPWRQGWTPMVRGGVCAVVLILLGVFGGAWLAALLAVGSCAWFGYSTRFGGRRTENGCELLEQLLGLRQFLRTASPGRIRNLQEKQPQYYFDLLPYAEALGVGKQFSAKLPAGRRIDAPDWLDLGQTKPMEPARLYSLYHALIQSLRAGEQVARAAKKRRKTQIGKSGSNRRR